MAQSWLIHKQACNAGRSTHLVAEKPAARLPGVTRVTMSKLRAYGMQQDMAER